jgi:hypothetical protein
MTDERFNALLNGPLSHPLFPFQITRLALALKAVVDATGEAGDHALEAYCADLDAGDRQAADPSILVGSGYDPMDTCRSCGQPLGTNEHCEECRTYGRPQ